MIYVALGELAVIALLAIALWRSAVWFAASSERREQLHRQERYELQERIRAPEQRPASPHVTRRRGGDEGRDKPKDLGALAQIGTVVPMRDNEQGTTA